MLRVRKMKIQNRKKHTRRNIWIIALIIVALLVAGGYYFWANYLAPKQQATNDSQETTSASTEDRTYTAETEDEEVTVPDNVDPSSIKNYSLITENETFKIRELEGEYYITLYAVINRPDQADMYRDQLRQYKQDALSYLRTNNINPDQVKIHYEPSEAASL